MTFHDLQKLIEREEEARIVSDALKFVTQKEEQVDTLQRIDENIAAIEEEETTTGGVF